ncbi:CDP-glycerol glycerophosphotransferase family protein [Brevibacterium sp.]|uniref:CDP-glycerol glycerophosphotransferase family protein n=1 Tax=Brevibacterium sp. TaxID=1701 RepID=UPI0026479A88|nr:CDP-glycerol glycerophosphotransferase family protein [Brevibacterium sp.]MDN6605163.1 CDP-glycerol glycerophosphotransferase family protein [Brevibacterium sp.]
MSIFLTPLRTGRFVSQKLNDAVHIGALRKRLRQDPAFLPPEDGPFDVLLNFPDRPINLYQVRQWYGPLEHLSQRLKIGILCYHPETARQISKETSLKIVLTPGYSDLSEVEEFLQPKVILYPNQNYANYRILGLESAEHVFICHGESDKIYMASNWVKVFNYFFVAGQASRDRLTRHVRNYDVDDRTIMIGRPQIDIPQPIPFDWDDDRTTIIYAPTWEGGRQTMRYGSVASHGVAIVQALVSKMNLRLIYRPHPRTGIYSDDFLSADAKIRQIIAAANAADETAFHLVDETPFGWQLTAADLMITDISAVAYDWLTTGKPLLVTEPVESKVPTPHEGIMTILPRIQASATSSIVSIIDSVLHDDVLMKTFAEGADYYYGDRRPGASLQRFTAAVDFVLEERDRNLWSQDYRYRPMSNASLAGPFLASPPTTVAAKPRLTSAVKRVDAIAKPVAKSLSRAARRILTATVLTSPTKSLVARSANVAEYQQQSPIVVTAMGDPEDLVPLVDWLPALELTNSSERVTIIVGNLHAYKFLKRRTRLRILVGDSATVTESYYSELEPLLDVHFDQAKLNLREAGHNAMRHVYVGSSGTLEWLNNRLRLFDSIILPPQLPDGMIRKALIHFPETVDIVSVGAEDTAAVRARTLRDAVEYSRELRQTSTREVGQTR